MAVSEGILKVIKNKPGLDIYAIKSQMQQDLVKIKKTLVELETQGQVVSGLQKEGTVFRRVYFSSP